jgi:hypothetical protein
VWSFAQKAQTQLFLVSCENSKILQCEKKQYLFDHNEKYDASRKFQTDILGFTLSLYENIAPFARCKNISMLLSF